jgi:pimeloyl-ACP methyl ester carboxylesterase
MQVREGFVESQGHQLAFLAVNEQLRGEDKQPVIVFIHGVLASINFWRDCVPPSFKENRAWYSLSLPAHHPSTVPNYFEPEQVNDQWFFQVMNGALENLLGTKKAIIIGHSTGGFCALNLAIKHAPNVAAIISVAGFHSGKWGGFEGLLVKLAGMGKWAKGLFVTNLSLFQKNQFMQRLFAASLAHDQTAYFLNPRSQQLLDNIFPNISKQDYADLFPLFYGIGSIEIANQLKQINVPCYVFASTRDPVVPPVQSTKLSDEIPGAKTVTFHNSGHMPFIEDTEHYFSAVEDAIADLTKQIEQQ